MQPEESIDDFVSMMVYLFFLERDSVLEIDNETQLNRSLREFSCDSYVNLNKDYFLPLALKMFHEFCGYKTIDFGQSGDMENFYSHARATELLEHIALESMKNV